MRDEFWLEDQSPDLFDIEDDQTPDTFGAFSNVLRGPEGPPGPPGPPGADGTVSFDELTPAQRESLRGEGVPAGGTTGQVLAKSSNTDYETEWVNQSGGSASMTILSYGHSTWADFIAAYNAKSIVYCRASITAADPGAGSQVRMAAMAYVNHPTVPPSVDFVYYYPATHSNSQQGDQLFVYTLSQTNGWSYVVKNTFSRVVAGENMTSSYANGTLTLNATGGTAYALPLAGGTMEGDIDMDGNAVTGLPTPSANSDAVPKSYADTKYSKPSGGIPASDLASAVQTSLGLADSALQSVPSTYRTAAEQDMIDAAQDAQIEALAGSLATIESSPATAAHAVGDYIVYNGKLYTVTAAITSGQMLTPGTNISATNIAGSFISNSAIVDITNQCSIPTGNIAYVKYLKFGSVIFLLAQVFNINFAGANIWLKLPDSFPGDASVFTALATGFDGMVCVFRTQSGNGKYLLVQSTQTGSYNLTATGICFT